MIEAVVIADSLSPSGDRLTTLEVQFPRWLLPEFNTYRQWSRSSASSRAIPLRKKNGNGTLDMAERDPSMPFSWPCEQPGMSGGSELDGLDLELAKGLFNEVRQNTLATISSYVEYVSKIYSGLSGDDLKSHLLHKSLINRLIEPHLNHRVIVTATEWDNMFNQRIHPDAQPEFRELATQMKHALGSSLPNQLGYGDYHLPYVRKEEQHLSLNRKISISIARCARVSYLNHNGETSIAKDVELFEKLYDQNPPHWAPFEHVACPAKPKRWYTPWRSKPAGNFSGWEQVRHNRPKGLV